MKFDSEKTIILDAPLEVNGVDLPDGLIGFPELKRMELVYAEEEAPFMWLKATGDEGLTFLVINPFELVEDYSIELLDGDVEALGLKAQEDALVLTIVTIHKGTPEKVTVNLIGPIVINRLNQKGKQVVIRNFQKLSAHHLLSEGNDGAEAAEA